MHTLIRQIKLSYLKLPLILVDLKNLETCSKRYIKLNYIMKNRSHLKLNSSIQALLSFFEMKKPIGSVVIERMRRKMVLDY